MNNTVLLVSLKTLKDEYTFDDNMSDKYIISSIKKGQDFIITPLLGLTKYTQLIDDIELGNVSVEDDVLIKKYIAPVLAYYAMSESVYSTAYKLKNNPDYQTSPNGERFNELVRISKKYLLDSQHYEQILRDYICDSNTVLENTNSRSGYKTGLNIYL